MLGQVNDFKDAIIFPLHRREGGLLGQGLDGVPAFVGKNMSWQEILSQTTEPEELASLVSRVEELVDTLIQSGLDAQAPEVNTGERPEGPRSIYSAFCDSLGEEEMVVFEKLFAVKMLEWILCKINNLPSLSGLMDDDFDSRNLDMAIEVLKDIDIAGDVLMALEGLFEKQGEALKIFSADILHDQGNIIYNLRSSLSIVADPSMNIDDPFYKKIKKRVANSANHIFKLFYQIIGGNLAIVKKEFPLMQVGVEDMFVPSGTKIAERFGAEVLFAGDLDEAEMEGLKDRSGAIVLDVEGGLMAHLHSSSIGLKVYNEVKNALKAAPRSEKGAYLIAVIVAAKRLEADAISIGVEDNGVGFDLDELYDHYRKIAKKKLQTISSGKSDGAISLVDFCLAGDLWREVPPARMLEKPMMRGESFSGGTGVGLDLARRIVEDGHQGMMVVDKGRHLKGALVESILPDTACTDPGKRRSITERIVRNRCLDALSEWKKIMGTKGVDGISELKVIAEIETRIGMMNFEELKEVVSSGILMRIRAFAEESGNLNRQIEEVCEYDVVA